MLDKRVIETYRQLSKAQKTVVAERLRQFLSANRNVGLEPDVTERDRAFTEAVDMVQDGHLTAKDNKPTEFNIMEGRPCQIDTYVSPRVDW
jgi:hypothetical protein